MGASVDDRAEENQLTEPPILFGMRVQVNPQVPSDEVWLYEEIPNPRDPFSTYYRIHKIKRIEVPK